MFTSIFTPKSKSEAGDALRLVPARQEVGPECATCPDGGLNRNF